jgi:hypothetical protein
MTNVNTPILNLPVATSLTGTEAVPIVQGGTTKRTTVQAVSGQQIQGTYANNAAAVAGGLSVGAFYKTATGEVRIVV